LSETQLTVLKRLGVGPYYPAGRHIVSATALTKKGLADYDRAHLSFRITATGRAALSEDKA